MIQNFSKMETHNYSQEQLYLKAKRRVKEIRDFYAHLSVYIVINIGISGVIVWGITRGGGDFWDAVPNFGVYATWLFWGIGLFFHWLNVFGLKYTLFGKDWEARKIKEFIEDDAKKTQKF